MDIDADLRLLILYILVGGHVSAVHRKAQLWALQQLEDELPTKISSFDILRYLSTRCFPEWFAIGMVSAMGEQVKAVKRLAY